MEIFIFIHPRSRKFSHHVVEALGWWEELLNSYNAGEMAMSSENSAIY